MKIELQDVSKRFGKKRALDGLTLSIDTGVYGLLGPNGAGKTTLMRCLLGRYECSGGSILVDGQKMGKHHSLSAHCGYLPQSFDFFHELTCREVLAYFCALKKIPRRQWSEEANRCLRVVNLLGEEKKKVGALSGGMRRRLGIAQALLGDPPLLIFDEPTAGLDPEERMRFKNIVAEVKGGRTILISTHIVDDIDVVCDHILVISQGRLLASGKKEAICRCAQGLVYCLPRNLQKDLVGDWSLENIFEEGGEEWIRILSSEPQPCQAVAPNLEDGYFSLVREVSSWRPDGSSLG